MSSLAGLYRRLESKNDQAEPLYQRALSIREKALGKNHSLVGRSLNDLAAVNAALGKYEKVEPMYRRALSITKKTLGKDHPDVAIILSNIASLYKTQGKYEESAILYQQALAILKTRFPNGHPNIDGLTNAYNKLKFKIN